MLQRLLRPTARRLAQAGYGQIFLGAHIGARPNRASLQMLVGLVGGAPAAASQAARAGWLVPGGARG